VSAKNVAIIPARWGSKRLPHKNGRDFYGKTVVGYTIESALESGVFENVILSTDNGALIKQYSNVCRIHDRPTTLAGDEVRLVTVVAEILREWEDRGKAYDNLCVLYATAPLRDSVDILCSYILLLESGADFCMGVSEYEKRLWHAFRRETGRIVRAFPEQAFNVMNRQDYYRDNGSIYWAKVEAFKKVGEFEGPNTAGYVMPRWKGFDVDTQADWDRLEWEAGRHGWAKKPE